MVLKRPKSCSGNDKVLNKKRNYMQFHLELGQSIIILHMSAVFSMIKPVGIARMIIT